MIDFLKLICGLHSTLVLKRLYTKRPAGLGSKEVQFSVLVRVLDALDKYLKLDLGYNVWFSAGPSKESDPYCCECHEMAAECLAA